MMDGPHVGIQPSDLPKIKTKADCIKALNDLAEVYNCFKLKAMEQKGGILNFHKLSYAERGADYWKWYFMEEAVQRGIAVIKGECL